MTLSPTPVRTALLGLALAGLLAGQVPTEPAAGGSSAWVLPEGEVAEAWAAVEPSHRAAALPAAWPELADTGAWGASQGWSRWSALVLAEREAATPDPGRRAALALLAAKEGRHTDAWKHFVACRGEPGVLTALLPRLVPGVPAAQGRPPAATQAGPLTLAPGTLLSPILPPVPPGQRSLGLVRRECAVSPLRVGASKVAFALRVEADGVQIDLRHLSGPATTLRVRLPEPPDTRFDGVYQNWVPVDADARLFTFELSPDDTEPQSLWGRIDWVERSWPARLPEGLPTAWERAGLAVAIDAADPERARLEGLARGLAAVCGVDLAVLEDGEAHRPAADLAPLRLDWRPDPARGRMLRALVSLAEAWALDAPAPGPPR